MQDWQKKIEVNSVIFLVHFVNRSGLFGKPKIIVVIQL